MSLTGKEPLAIAGVAAAVFVVVSTVGALTVVALQNWFGMGDLQAMVIWSAAATPLVFGVVRLLLRFTRRWNLVATFVAHGVGAIFIVAVWTAVEFLILGPWLGAFSFPAPTLWLLGALLGSMAAALMVHRQGWLLAGVTCAVPLLGAILFARAETAKPPDIIIHIQEGLPTSQRERVWCEVLGHPAPSGIGCSPLPGIQTTSAFDGDGESRYRVGFQPGTTSARRDEIVKEVAKSPLVGRVEDYDPNRHTIVDIGR